MGKRRAGFGPQNRRSGDTVGIATAVGETAPSFATARHLAAKPKWSFWTKACISMLLAMILVITFVLAAYLKLDNNIQSAELYQPGEIHTSEPVVDDSSPIDILVVGTDTRTGADSRFGGEDLSAGEGFADVMLAVHISGNRQRVTVVSIPRDTIASFPGCVDAAGGPPWPATDAQMLNVALKMGGPSCLRKTLGDLSGISFGHFMVADFNAVIELTNIVGGVEVCVDQPIDDAKSLLALPAGNSTIQGEQALAFLRTRSAFGDASDLARITAQQGFLSSLVRKMKSEATLTNIPKLYAIAEAVTKNITLDTSLAHIPALLQMANRLKDVNTANVTFITAPNEPYTYDTNRVQLQTEPASRLFQAIIADQDISTSVRTEPTTSPPSQSLDNPPPPVVPQENLDPTDSPAPIISSATAGTDQFEGQNADQHSCQKTSGF